MTRRRTQPPRPSPPPLRRPLVRSRPLRSPPRRLPPPPPLVPRSSVPLALPSVAYVCPDSQKADGDDSSQVKDLKEKMAKLKTTIEGLEKERNFYFGCVQGGQLPACVASAHLTRRAGPQQAAQDRDVLPGGAREGP